MIEGLSQFWAVQSVNTARPFTVQGHNCLGHQVIEAVEFASSYSYLKLVDAVGAWKFKHELAFLSSSKPNIDREAKPKRMEAFVTNATSHVRVLDHLQSICPKMQEWLEAADAQAIKHILAKKCACGVGCKDLRDADADEHVARRASGPAHEDP